MQHNKKLSNILFVFFMPAMQKNVIIRKKIINIKVLILQHSLLIHLKLWVAVASHNFKWVNI